MSRSRHYPPSEGELERGFERITVREDPYVRSNNDGELAAFETAYEEPACPFEMVCLCEDDTRQDGFLDRPGLAEESFGKARVRRN
jgi:hypothetical protein